MKELPVQTSTWDDAWVFSLNTNQKIVWMFLLTNPFVNIAGVINIAPVILGTYCGLDLPSTMEVINFMASNGKIVYCENCIVMLNWYKYHSYNERTIASADKILDSLPCDIKLLIEEVGMGSEGVTNGLPTHLSNSNSNSNNINTLKREEKSVRGEERLEKKPSISVDWELVMQKWNELPIRFPNISSISKVSDGRKAKYLIRLKSGLDFIKSYPVIVEMIGMSSFLKGERTNWKINFDHLFQSDKAFLKVIEGGHSDTEKSIDGDKF